LAGTSTLIYLYLLVNEEEAKSFRVLGLYNPFLPSLIFAGRAERID
jgi:hypothetical protein